MDSISRSAAPSLLPILRSQQQGSILAAVLGHPDEELSIAALSKQVGVPYASVHREIERAEQAGIVQSRRLGNIRLLRANRDSPYFEGLASVLVRAFGPPAVLANALAEIEGVQEAWLFGSWAARFEGVDGDKPVGDLDLLILGDPDRDVLFGATSTASGRLGREVQVTVREPGWLEAGTGTFHDTVTSRPMVRVAVDPAIAHS